MTRKQRLERVLGAWDEFVGEMPDDGPSKLGAWASHYGIENTIKAMLRCEARDDPESSEDVLAAMPAILRTTERER